jgi:hypothetical protein
MTVQLPTADPRAARETQPSNAGDGTSIQAGASRRLAAPAPTRARRLSPRLRKAILAAHVLVGVGWFGIVVAKLVLEAVATTTRDQGVARAGYLFMETLDRAVFPPAAIATLVTGVVLSVGTAWGLFRHWWIVVKLVLTVAVVVTGVAFVGAWTEAAAATAARPAVDAVTDADLGSASLLLIGAAVAHLLMLGAAAVISVFKPWGQIRPDHRDTVRRTAGARTT